MLIDPSAWYDPTPDTSAFYQGDIIYDVPIVLMPPSGKQWLLLRPNKGTIEQVKKGGFLPTAFAPRTESQATNPWSDGTDLVLAKGSKLPVAILTQTCDLDNRKHFQCAPVWLIQGNKTPEEIAQAYHQFPLPGDQALASSYIELSMVSSVHTSYLKKAKLVKRLSAYARSSLQLKLARFFGRPFGFTTKDEVPQGSDYVCSKCFFSSGDVTKMSFTQGVLFESCPKCGEAALWTKLPSEALAQIQSQTNIAQPTIVPPEPEFDVPGKEEDQS